MTVGSHALLNSDPGNDDETSASPPGTLLGVMAQGGDPTASSTGQAMTSGAWLDLHFEAARPEYEAQLRAVGIQRGWHVLDAGAGSGAFLPWLAELVGPTGRLAAIDLAPDNVRLIEQRVAGSALPCPVESRTASVFGLPFPDGSFDAVWFANTSQYLTDEELGVALAELRRVVRPGGLVAVKDSDITMYRLFPGPAGVALRFWEARARRGIVHAIAALRVPALPHLLRQSGLTHVRQRTTLIERAAPFEEVVRRWLSDLFAYLAEAATGLDLPPTDRDYWATLRDPAALARYLDDPDFWFIEANVLTVGTVSGGA